MSYIKTIFICYFILFSLPLFRNEFKTWKEIIEIKLITLDLFEVNCQYFKVEAIEWTVME